MRDYLKQGTRIKNLYIVITKIGEGATCVAYSCQEPNGRRVVIKEYYPINLSIKREDNYLKCSEKDKKRFSDGLQHFKETVQLQVDIRRGKMSPKASVKNQVFDITDSFEWFDTYYCVMTEFSGRVFTQNAEITLYDRIRTCKAIAQYVKGCHESGFLCLDIKPDNIYVLSDTHELPMFFDFDSVISKEDARMGRNLSYSEKWAAPEQIIPGGFKEISEATDVYALGELVFWSVFDRNSFDEEHRPFSHYPYQDSPFAKELRSVCRKTLDEVFLHTIQSLCRRRYQTVGKLIENLDLLLNELLPRKHRLISSVPPCLSYFVGREEELEKLELILEEKHFAILLGLGGIGKSEIAKKFCARTDKYDDIVFLSYGSDLVSTLVQANFVSDIEQKEKEKDSVYCKRKLEAFAEICNPRTLLVIDNLNEELERIEDGDIFKRILELKCDLLLTTRCYQETYKEFQVEVDHLDTEYLVELYRENKPFLDDQEMAVREIIQRTQNHTLLVELISKLAKNTDLSPEDMLERIESNGVFVTGSDTVKWNQTTATIEEHVGKLFDMSGITDEQMELLYKFSLMPLSGVRFELFCKFYSIDRLSDLRLLIDKGWIKENIGVKTVLSMHSIIAQVVVTKTERKGLVPNDFMRQLYERLHDYKPTKNLKSSEVYPLFQSISESILRLGVRNLFAANYNTLFVHTCNDYFSDDPLLKAIKFSVNIYDELYKEEYSIPREIGYFVYVKFLIKSDKLEDKESKWIYSHYLNAKENRVKIWETCWLAISPNAWGMLDSSELLSIWLPFLSLKRKLKKYNVIFNDAKELPIYHEDYPYDSIEYVPDVSVSVIRKLLDLPFEYFRASRLLRIASLYYLLRLRCHEKKLCRVNGGKPASNRLLKIEAKLDIILNRFADSVAKLQTIIQNLNRKNPISKEAHEVNFELGRVYLILKEYEKAEKCLKTCLYIEKSIEYDSSCDAEIQLFELYISKEDIRRAHEVFMSSLIRTTEMKILLLKYQLLVISKQVEVNGENADIPFLDKSFEENYTEIYQSIGLPPENLDGDMARLYRARMKELKAKYTIITKNDYSGACEDMKIAYKDLKKCLGKKHPETIDCKTFLYECRGRAKEK